MRKRVKLGGAVVAVGMIFATALMGQTTPRGSVLPAGTRPATSTRPALPAATGPAALKEGWEEIDQRLVFLTVQLSTIEATLDATNKSLKVNGYQQAAKQAAADLAQQANANMDRNGGGPVPWQDFYGRTAEKFFYHPTDRNTVHVNPLPIDNRPPQFDYIYRANEANRAKAEGDAAKIGNKIEDLLDYRRQLEAEQSALWCKIAWRAASSMELDARPMYRLDLAGGNTDAGQQSVSAARAAVAFMRAVNAEIVQDQKTMDSDPKGTLEHLQQATADARAALQTKFLKLPLVAEGAGDPRNAVGQFTRSCKRLEDSAQNLVDAYRLAADCDARDDVAGKLSYRGQLQQMVFDYASTMATADASLKQMMLDGKVVPMTNGLPEPLTQPAVPLAVESIPARLDTAKATHDKDIAAARRSLVAAVDVSLNAAADAGDLSQVQALQSAKMKVAHDGMLPEEIKDESLTIAKGQMTSAIAEADAKLVAAYREAISNYTKARKIAEAQATLDELNASGLNTAASPAAVAAAETPAKGVASASQTGFTPPTLANGLTQIDLPAPVDEVVVGGGGRYLLLHLKKLQQLAVFDVSSLKVLKYIPLPTNDISYAAGTKKLFIGLKDLRQIQRWDLTRLELELTVAAPEGGIGEMATGANANGPLVMVGNKRFWLINPNTLKAETYPSQHWGSDGSAWGPVHVHASFDGGTIVACGGGWAGIEISNIVAGKVVNVQAGSYVNGDALVAGNGALVFPNDGGIVRSDLASGVKGIEGHPFPADDSAFSLSFRKEGNKASLVLYSNADPRPLTTLTDLPELAKDSKLPIWQRVQLIPAAKALVTLGPGNDHLILRKFDLAEELEAGGIDYLFVESAPAWSAQKGTVYTYKMVVRSKKGVTKMELQSGPKGMTLSPDGTIRWTVPSRTDETHSTVIVQITDSAGQTVFHSFQLSILDAVNTR